MEPEVLEYILDGKKKPTKLQFSLLMNITENFSEEREIGKGGFATVYKGVLPNGNVAVKRIMNRHTIDDALFYREVDNMLAVNHQNIVQFLGYCASTDLEANPQEGRKAHIFAEQRERLLCFEYIGNGSLQEHITDELRGLEWNARYEIIKGICNGLDYLHNEKRIYHMDLKPANILLDSNLVPKITDFSQSRYDEKSQTISLNRYGSRGYCPPEYALFGNMSPKSDMYSLGTIIIELVTGDKEIPNNNKCNVLRRWRHRWRKTGKETLLGYQQVTKCIDIGILCQEIDPCNRPFIREIVHDIKEMEGTNSQNRNDNESTVGQITTFLEDDMLGIVPLELHFPFELSKEISRSLQLSNETDSYIAFEVQKMSPLAYCIEPHKGIVPPRSEYGVNITLQPQDTTPKRANEFIVRSTKVNHGLRAEDISTTMFSRDTGNFVDEVNFDVVFAQDPNSSKRKEANDWIKKYPLIGRESQSNELHSYIYQAYNSKFGVVSVWGMAGIGKSALVRNMYHHIILQEYQFNKFSWVNVSQPFNIKDFSRSLLSDYHSQGDPIKECHELLSQHGCLVVIDGLQSKEEWDLIQAELFSGPSSSVIIVITTEAYVATYCIGDGEQVCYVKGLDATAAMHLFRTEVHRNNASSRLNYHEDVNLEELILKCGGLPKVIISVAASLARKTVTWIHNIRSLNQRFMDHLEINPEYDSLRGLLNWMDSYFSTCPDSLKASIFYLSISPDNNIWEKRLVRRWIANGYSRDRNEESAVELLYKLLSLSIMEPIPQLVGTAHSDTRLLPYQVNGFFREYILSQRKEDNHVFVLGPNDIPTTQPVVHHLIILRSWDRNRIVFESIDFSRLRSLTVLGNWESFFISRSMMLLLVLDLEDALGVKDDDLEKMIKMLCGLTFLSLRGCSEINRLPSSLGNLSQLETLDVRNTSIVTLPASIGKLQRLQYIRAGAKVPASTQPASSSRFSDLSRGRGLVGVKVPLAIENLKALHTLDVVNIGASAGSKYLVERLKKLTQLRKLGVSGINKYNKKVFFATSGHVHLESLLVQLDKDDEDCLDNISLPWKNLQSLTLYGLLNKFPWKNPLSKPGSWIWR